MSKKNLQIILDNGHGVDTKGKCSPKLSGEEFDLTHPFVKDGRFREYLFNRAVVNKLADLLASLNFKVTIIVSGSKDVPLRERVNRINSICKRHGAKNCMFISVHSNAACNEWSSARGTSVHIASNASMKSKALAKHIYNAATTLGFAGNRSVPKERYWVDNFYIIKNTACPCVLTENLFYTNKDDLKTLMSEDGIKKIVDYHIAGIVNYSNENFWPQST